jgi:hypothetical protein
VAISIVQKNNRVVQDDHVAHLMLYDDCIWDTGQALYDPDEEHCAGLLPGRWVALIQLVISCYPVLHL